jgi:pilus assembly protein Flp/PilA
VKGKGLISGLWKPHRRRFAGAKAWATRWNEPQQILSVPRMDPCGHEKSPEDTMKSLAKKMQRFLVSEDGPTAVEYAVMLALIIIVCLTAIGTIGTNANTTFTRVGNSIAS